MHLRAKMYTIAVMQPYFLPYAGYFRLFAASDLFVLYDCVQFPRRGWVHRNRLLDRLDRPQWLTLPIATAPQTVRIADLEFPADAESRLSISARRFPALEKNGSLVDAVMRPRGSVVDYLEQTLALTCAQLSIPFRAQRSSALGIDPGLRGEDRILAICRALGADRYVNSPGGRQLYESSRFVAEGIELRFLAPYRGPEWSILQRLHSEPTSAITKEIQEQLALEP